MNLPKLLRFNRKEPELSPLISPDEAAKLKAALEDKPAPKPQPRGRVIKETKHAEFDPRGRRARGGRVVKAMPRQLVKIKQQQEKVEDDGPTIED